MPDVTITLRTIDESAKNVQKIKKEYESLFPAVEKAGQGLTSFVSKNATVIAAVVGVGAALKNSFDAWQKYAGQVENLARVSQTGAKEASILLQVLDDYKISAEDVSNATRAMKEKGLVPTLETLAQLSDAYKAIQDPAKKLQFAQDNLGRSYEKYLKVLEAGGSTLRQNANEVNKALILTDEQIKQADEQRLALDEVADAWQGLKISVGAYVGGIILAGKKNSDFQEEFQRQHAATGISLDDFAQKVADEEIQLQRGAAMTDYYNKMLGQTSVVVEEVEADYKGLISSTERIAQETEDYTGKQKELNKKQAELRKEIDGLIKQGYTPLNKNVKELQEEYDALGTEASQLADEHEQAMKRMQYDLIATKLATNGLDSAEYELQIQIGKTLGVFDEGSAKAAIGMGRLADLVAAGDKRVRDLDRAMRLMEEHEYNIDVVLSIIGKYTATPGAPGGSGPPTKRAKGGFLGEDWTLVGDLPGGIPTPYSELISPSGWVFDAQTTRKMLESNMFNGVQSRVIAGELPGGGGGTSRPSPIATSPVQRIPRPGGGGGGGSRGGGGTGGAVIISAGIPEADGGDQQVQLAQEVRAMQVEIRQQVQQAMTVSVDAINDNIGRLIDAIVTQSPREISKGVGYELAKVVG